MKPGASPAKATAAFRQEKKTPAPFIASCNKFIYIEILKKEERVITASKTTSKETVKKSTPAVASVNRDLIKLISDSINDIDEEDGWVFLGVLGSLILKKQPDFDPRNYGHKKLIDLIKSIPQIEIDDRPSGKKNISHYYVRTK